jgi:drug/metabolite transporter (DMT)-like permease
MKVASSIVTTVLFALVGLLLIWGGWLSVTDDPDGGRHPVGAVMLVVAVLGAVLGLVLLRRSRRP